MAQTKENEIIVYTHSGVFHQDEVYATAMLRNLFDEKILVNRVPRVDDDLPEGTIVYDIGGGELDHHQSGGNGGREIDRKFVPYSSAGLVWRKFGPKKYSDRILQEVDRSLVQYIDAQDNGVSEGKSFDSIGVLNPRWNEDTSPRAMDAAFEKAVSVASVILEGHIKNALSKIEAETEYQKAISNLDGKYLVLGRFFPWVDYLTNDPNGDEVLYVIFPSLRGGYNLQAVPLKGEGFKNRKPLPESWRGKKGDELREVTGVASAGFCHPAGFIGGADTLDGAIRMAKLAIQS